MRKIYGFIDLFGAPELGPLTAKRNFGSVTFLGRYGLLDFALSNFSNSGIDRLGILVDRHYNSVRNHIRNGSAFTINTKTGRLHIMVNEEGILTPELNTDIMTVNMSKDFIKDGKTDYVIISPPACR